MFTDYYGIKYTESIKQIRHTTSEPLPCGPGHHIFKKPHRIPGPFPWHESRVLDAPFGVASYPYPPSGPRSGKRLGPAAPARSSTHLWLFTAFRVFPMLLLKFIYTVLIVCLRFSHCTYFPGLSFLIFYCWRAIFCGFCCASVGNCCCF